MLANKSEEDQRDEEKIYDPLRAKRKKIDRH
mgnify:CR=1 FL=1